MTAIVRSLAAVACSFVLLAACSESHSELDSDAASDDTTSTTDAHDDAHAGDDAEQEAIAEGVIDLENPVIREQFVRTFSQTTGLTLEQADCVAQYFIDNGVNDDALIAAAGGAEPDVETVRQVSEAMDLCA